MSSKPEEKEKRLPEQFNDIVKKIFNTFKDLNLPSLKSKVHIKEMQSKMVQGMNTEEEYPITVLGPHLWQGKESIIKRDSQHFLNRRYELELQSLCIKHKVNYDNAINTVNYMKEVFKIAPQDKQKEIMEDIFDLLGIYVKYKKAKTEEAEAKKSLNNSK